MAYISFAPSKKLSMALFIRFAAALFLIFGLITISLADALSDFNRNTQKVDVNFIRNAGSACKAEIDKRTGGNGVVYGPCQDRDGKVNGVSISTNGYILKFHVAGKNSVNYIYDSFFGDAQVIVTCRINKNGGITDIESKKIRVVNLDGDSLCSGQGQLF